MLAAAVEAHTVAADGVHMVDDMLVADSSGHRYQVVQTRTEEEHPFLIPFDDKLIKNKSLKNNPALTKKQNVKSRLQYPWLSQVQVKRKMTDESLQR